MKICIVGSGGVGGYIGAMLANNTQHDVTMVARGEHKEAMESEGLQIVEDNITWQTSAFEVATLETLEGYFDLVLFCVKSYDLKACITAMKKHINSESILLPLGNGVAPYEMISQTCNAKVLRGAVYILSHIEAPGVIRKKGSVFAIVMGTQEHSDALNMAKAIFEEAVLRTKTPVDINQAVWKKYLFISAFATLTSYYNQNMQAVAERHEQECWTLLSEITSVAKAKGIDIELEMKKAYETALGLPASATTSMHLDFQNDKPTELETLSGYIVREGEALGVATVLMRKMYLALKNELYKKRNGE